MYSEGLGNPFYVTLNNKLAGYPATGTAESQAVRMICRDSHFWEMS